MEEQYSNNKLTDKMDEIFKPVGQDKPNYIKVVGVGGGGGNAVNHMMEEGIQGVDFILCNTDYQALQRSNVTNRVHLGKRELGAGNDPNIGREAAETSKEEIAKLLGDNIKMLFVTAGMGGGTGTGAAPVVARIAKERGVLTVGIVTMPMEREGRRRKLQAQAGIEELRKYVDTLILISTDKLRDQYGDMKLSEAFRKADDVLTTAAKGIAEIITVPGYVNVDFEDVTTVMKDSGKAIMGSGRAEGENRAEQAIKAAINSPLLNDSDIEGAKNVLLYITSGTDEVSLDEVDEILSIAQDACGNECDVIWGNGTDESLGNALGVTLIATGFNHDGKHRTAVSNDNDVKFQPVQPAPAKKTYDINGNILQDNIVTQAPVVEPAAQNPVTPTPVPTVNGPITREVPTSDEEKQEPAPEDKPQGPITHHLDDDVDFDPMPTAPSPTYAAQPEPVVTPYCHSEESKPTVRRFDNPFQEDSQNNGFEITSRVITPEELEVRQPIAVSVVEERNIRTVDPKDELKKQRLRALSMNFRTQKGLEELENQPAYLRRNIDIVTDNREDISHYYSSKDGLSSENSFLHDNVD